MTANIRQHLPLMEQLKKNSPPRMIISAENRLAVIEAVNYSTPPTASTPFSVFPIRPARLHSRGRKKILTLTERKSGSRGVTSGLSPTSA